MRRPSKLDWLVYRLFRWWWNPILRRNPNLIDGLIVEMGTYRKYAPTISDGFGSEWSIICPECGRDTMQVVRPGNAQCSECG